MQLDGLLVAIKSGSLWLEKWKSLLQGVLSLGLWLIHGIYFTGGVLMCTLDTSRGNEAREKCPTNSEIAAGNRSSPQGTATI